MKADEHCGSRGIFDEVGLHVPANAARLRAKDMDIRGGIPVMG
jgi:hypothetical protein